MSNTVSHISTDVSRENRRSKITLTQLTAHELTFTFEKFKKGITRRA